MKTIYNYDYNTDNLIIVLLIVVLLVLCIAIMFFFLPLLKDTYGLVKFYLFKTSESPPPVTRAETYVTIIVTFILYAFLSSAIIIFSMGLHQSKFDWVDTNITTCNLTSGKCENFSYEQFESRDYIWYYCDFIVNDITFSNVEIRQENESVINYLTEDYNLDVYYREINKKNYVIRIDVSIKNHETGDG